jgi:hypothetical protein
MRFDGGEIKEQGGLRLVLGTIKTFHYLDAKINSRIQELVVALRLFTRKEVLKAKCEVMKVNLRSRRYI